MSDKEKNTHAKYSPSASHRWLECPGSVELAALCPPSPETPQAKQGTEAHLCLEMFLKNGQEKMLSTGVFLREQGHPVEMVVHAESAARAIWKFTPKGAELLAETRSELFHIDKEMHGTTDATIIEHFSTLHVIDFKYGKFPVEAENNSQMMAYAIGLAHKFDYNFEQVICTIIQPRAYHEKGPVRSWFTTIENLLEWNERFKKGVKLAKRKDAPFKSGEHCFFCPAKKECFVYTPDDTKSVRSKFFTPKSPEAKRKQLLLDFGEPMKAAKSNNKPTANNER
jgi:hypothetical protein